MHKPTIQEVGAYYDMLNPFYETLWGDSIHFGYWSDPTNPAISMDEAQRAFTDLLIQQLNVQPGMRVLDVGCGTGRPAIQVVEKTGALVTGITVSAEQVRIATERAQASAHPQLLAFEQVNAMEMPFDDNSFDAAMAFESVFHMDRMRVFSEMARVVRPGGRVVVADFVTVRPMTQEEIDITYPAFAVNDIGSWQDYLDGLKEVGLTDTYVIDVTLNTIRPTNVATLHAFKAPEQQARLHEIYGEDQTRAFFEGWQRIRNVNETLAYVVCVATCPEK
ncbi:MAG: methyltransferase domain-containing protein [Chloroflexaceae bacterium]|nr:methyltransferase domain-containing protein [Chloroflexaceae bacterium]